MFDLIDQFLNTPLNWFLFLLCGMLIGMAKPDYPVPDL
jgi:hypothetical protein